jgi:hypothetical protein
MVKKCIIFFSYEGGPLVHLPEEGSVRDVVSRRLNRNWLPILEIVMDTVYSITIPAVVTNVDINLETEDDLRHLSQSCNDFHKYVLKIVSAMQ